MTYRFLSVWLVEAPRPRVWDVLQAVTDWPSWWRGVVDVDELDPGDERRVGARYAVTWRSRVPYPVRFEFTVETVDPPHGMEGRAVGDLEGRGRWRLMEDGGVTAVIYEWEVGTTKRWMKAVAPLAGPVFERNHDVVMGWGGEGLAGRLGVRLLAAG